MFLDIFSLTQKKNDWKLKVLPIFIRSIVDARTLISILYAKLLLVFTWITTLKDSLIFVTLLVSIFTQVDIKILLSLTSGIHVSGPALFVYYSSSQE